MGDYRRGSVKPVPLTVTYWLRVRGFESPISHFFIVSLVTQTQWFVYLIYYNAISIQVAFSAFFAYLYKKEERNEKGGTL